MGQPDDDGGQGVAARLLVLGGGAIGAGDGAGVPPARLGEVTVVEAAPRLLAREEPFAGDQVLAALEAEGIAVHTGTRHRPLPARRLRRAGPRRRSTTAPRSSPTSCSSPPGRRRATTDLGLDIVGLASGVARRGRRPPACGRRRPATGSTPSATARAAPAHPHGQVPGPHRRGRHPRQRRPRPSPITACPRVTFTDPQVCAVGLTEAQAARAGYRRPRARRQPPATCPAPTSSATASPAPASWSSTSATRVLVGATFIGPGVQELLHSATIAIAARGHRSTGCGTRSRRSRRSARSGCACPRGARHLRRHPCPSVVRQPARDRTDRGRRAVALGLTPGCASPRSSLEIIAGIVVGPRSSAGWRSTCRSDARPVRPGIPVVPRRPGDRPEAS